MIVAYSFNSFKYYLEPLNLALCRSLMTLQSLLTCQTLFLRPSGEHCISLRKLIATPITDVSGFHIQDSSNAAAGLAPELPTEVPNTASMAPPQPGLPLSLLPPLHAAAPHLPLMGSAPLTSTADLAAQVAALSPEQIQVMLEQGRIW